MPFKRLAIWLIPLTLTGVTFAHAQSPAEPPLPIVGGYQSAPVDDPEIKAAADFAITAAPKKYQLAEIVSARSQIVAGTNYSLCLHVKAQGFALLSHGRYVSAKVFRSLEQQYKLTDWRNVKTCE